MILTEDDNFDIVLDLADIGVSLSPTSYLGLLDRTRMFMCLFMLTLFIFNPFAGIVKLGREFPTSADSAGRAAARTLLSSDSSEPGMCVVYTPSSMMNGKLILYRMVRKNCAFLNVPYYCMLLR